MTVEKIAEEEAKRLMEMGFSDEEELVAYFVRAITKVLEEAAQIEQMKVDLRKQLEKHVKS